MEQEINELRVQIENSLKHKTLEEIEGVFKQCTELQQKIESTKNKLEGQLETLRPQRDALEKESIEKYGIEAKLLQKHALEEQLRLGKLADEYAERAKVMQETLDTFKGVI
jgi:hypothetical protein